MKKEDLLILLLAVALLLAAILTFFRGGEHSKHGAGSFLPPAKSRLVTIISLALAT